MARIRPLPSGKATSQSSCKRPSQTRDMIPTPLSGRRHVVEEDGTQLKVGSVEFLGQRWVVGPGEGPPGSPIEACVAGTAFKNHIALHQTPVRENFEANDDRALFENRWVDFVGNQRILGFLCFPVPS